MEDSFLSNILHTHLIGTKRGNNPDIGFDEELNSYLDLGWRVVNTWVERRSDRVDSEECLILLGWTKAEAPEYPEVTEDELSDEDDL